MMLCVDTVVDLARWLGLWKGCVCVVCLRRCVFLPFCKMHGSRGGTVGPESPSLKNHKNIGFLSNTGPDPLKISQSCKASMQCWALSGGQMMAHF